ncbi:alkaline-phosphatase-like protein [Tirmania nivea]|nr:alkaline-phosphatase-like protein [Tirmania nivea]
MAPRHPLAYSPVPAGDTPPHAASDDDGDGGPGAVPRDDLDVLREEEERERLLSRGSLFGSLGRRAGGVVIGRRRRGSRRQRPGDVGRRDSEERAGALADADAGSESDSDEITETRRGWVGEKRGLREPRPRAPSPRRVLALSAVLLALLLLLLYGALRLSAPADAAENAPFHAAPLTNGTHAYRPTTLLLSLDGFRASYLALGLTPTLQAFRNSGLSTPYLTPSFPSVTFPNHWTLVTGLYPESHGIVGNSFFDPAAKEEYYYTNRTSSAKPFWYGGSPIWSVAEENGVKAAIHMWPGSETYLYHPEAYVFSLDEFRKQKGGSIKRMAPSIVDPYNGAEPLPSKAARLLSWLDLPLESRPQLILGYVPNLDVVGHKFGPDTPEEKAELGKVDDMFKLLLQGVEARNLTDIVNIVVVSDHGMAKTHTEKLIYLEDVLGDNYASKTGKIEGWPLAGIRAANGADETELWEEVKSRHESWPLDTPTAQKAQLDEKDARRGSRAPWSVHHKLHSMPDRWHFSHNDRIAPIWIVPEVGWVCVTKDEYPPEKMPQGGYHPKGVHGYDNAAQEMRAVFVGWGPGFRGKGMHGKGREWIGKQERRVDAHGKEVKGVEVKPFGNWEVYGIIGELVFGADGAKRLLGPHNGTFSGGRGKEESVFEGMSVLSEGAWGEEETSSSSASISRGGTATATPARPVIAKPSAPPSTPASTAASTKNRITVDEPAVTVIATVTVIPTPSASPSPGSTHQHAGGKQEAGGTEEPDLDHKPSSMTWWEWAKWRAEKLKEKLQQWWGDVIGGGGSGGGKHEGKGA